MSKGRMEAFSDGVIAIIITIMVLELKVPHTGTLEALKELWPVFISYTMSFVFIGIYWNNHHHLLQATKQIDGRVLWANMHLLFWLSLIPFGTSWMGENNFSLWPVVLYGVIALGAGFAYGILTQTLLVMHGDDSNLAKAIGQDRKGMISVFCYLAAVGLAFVHPLISCALYILVSIMWLVPDRRIENQLKIR